MFMAGFPSLESALLDLRRDGTDWGWEYDFAERFLFVSYDRRGASGPPARRTGSSWPTA